jgi:hypothetical protein
VPRLVVCFKDGVVIRFAVLIRLLIIAVFCLFLLNTIRFVSILAQSVVTLPLLIIVLGPIFVDKFLESLGLTIDFDFISIRTI